MSDRMPRRPEPEAMDRSDEAQAYAVDEVQEQLEQAGLARLQVARVTDRHLDVFGSL